RVHPGEVKEILHRRSLEGMRLRVEYLARHVASDLARLLVVLRLLAEEIVVERTHASGAGAANRHRERKVRRELRALLVEPHHDSERTALHLLRGLDL